METNLIMPLLQHALDASHLRQQAISQNIANLANPEYEPLDVRFAEQLREERGDVPQFEPLQTPHTLDAQVALSVENATQYRALLRGMNHELALLKLAMQGNAVQ